MDEEEEEVEVEVEEEVEEEDNQLWIKSGRHKSITMETKIQIATLCSFFVMTKRDSI